MQNFSLPQKLTLALTLLVVMTFGLTMSGCSSNSELGGSAGAASKVYVPPGEYDEFYAFFSGGYSGHLTVYGLPSGRLIKTIPVFSRFAENGYG